MPENETTTTSSAVLIDSVADWLMSQALGEGDVHDIVGGCCDRLLAAGIPLWRGFVSFRILTSDDWRQSPMNHMLTTQIPYLRRRLTGEQALLDFPVCRELRERGGSDYVAWMVPFARDDEPGPHADGVIGSWATDRPSGFSDGEIRSLTRIQRRLVVSLKVQIKQQIARTVLATYLGMDAGRRVLDGQIRRGDGEMLHAVIWFSDMRDSTRLADGLPAEEFLKTINSYFECTAGAVLANGGEVLRFIGDAVLAIFPIRDGDPRSACELALSAAGDAESRLQALNDERAGDNLEPLDYGLGLHVGDVMFRQHRRGGAIGIFGHRSGGQRGGENRKPDQDPRSSRPGQRRVCPLCAGPLRECGGAHAQGRQQAPGSGELEEVVSARRRCSALQLCAGTARTSGRSSMGQCRAAATKPRATAIHQTRS